MGKIKGRAYTASEKKDIIDRLYMAWLDVPNLRLGQLILNATYPDMFYIEDETFIEAIEKFTDDCLKDKS